jgi:hypothetical protein
MRREINSALSQYSALYGLKVKDEQQHFNKLQNVEKAKSSNSESNKIELEIAFYSTIMITNTIIGQAPITIRTTL